MRLKLKPTSKVRKIALIVFVFMLFTLEWGGTLHGQGKVSADTQAASHQTHSLLSRFTIFGDTTDPNCESSGFTLNWAFCGIYDGLSDTSTWILTHLIEPELKTAPLCVSGTGAGCKDDPTYAVWSNFRIYGDVFLVIALLVIVFSEAIGGGLLDAYTVKRSLPRLLAAAILINLSIYIVAFALDVGNIVGGGIGTLITAPLKGAGAFTIHPNGSISTAEVGVAGFLGLAFAAKGLAGAATSKGGLKALFSLKGGSLVIDGFLIPAFLLLVAIIATIAIRKAIILALVFVSPVAFALYALPNTEQYFKRWWKTLQEMVIIYPIIILLFAVSDVLSVTVESPTASTGAAADGVNLLMSFVFLIIPLFLIPFSFKLAGGVLGRIHDLVDGGRKKAHSWGEQRREHGKAQYKARDIETRARRYAAMNKYASRGGFGGKAVRGLAGFYGGYNIDAEDSKQRAETAKVINDIKDSGKDGQVRGILIDMDKAVMGVDKRVTDKGVTQYKSLGGAWVDESDVIAGQKRWGHDTYAMQAALSYEMTKADTEDDVERIRKNFSSTASSLGVAQHDIDGMWQGAIFQNQGKHLALKYTDSDGSMSEEKRKAFASEMYGKIGTYQASQMHPDTIVQLEAAYDAAEKANDTETMAKIEAVAENFVSRYGGGLGAPPGAAGAEDEGQRAQAVAQQAAAAAANAAGVGGAPVGAPPGAGAPAAAAADQVVQTNTPGAAAVAQAVRRLAKRTGVLSRQAPPTDIGAVGTGPDIDPLR